MKQLTLTNGKVIVINEDYLIVKNSMLWNNNTQAYEGVDGDVIWVNVDGEKCKFKVKDYTNGLVIPTRKAGTITLVQDEKYHKRVSHRIYITAEEEVETQ